MSVKYEDVKVKLEPRETRESHLLLVHIPEGFQRQHIGAKVEFDYGRVKVYGELPPENNVIRRFSEVYKVPETCDINNIRGKLDGRIVTITMRKREISEVPEQESQQPAQEAPKTPVQETEPKPEKDEEGTPPQPQPGEYQQEEPTSDEEGTPPQSEPGEYQQQEPAADEEGDQKDQEGLSEQGPKSPIENKEKAHIETPTQPADATEKPTPEMDQKWVPPKATFEDSQREEIEKRSSEQGKQPEKAVLDKSPATEEDNNRKRKASSDPVVTHVPKSTGNNLGKFIPESTAKRMTFLEDKQKLIYMGAAFAVVALGAYVTYKLRSSARK